MDDKYSLHPIDTSRMFYSQAPETGRAGYAARLLEFHPPISHITVCHFSCLKLGAESGTDSTTLRPVRMTDLISEDIFNSTCRAGRWNTQLTVVVVAGVVLVVFRSNAALLTTTRQCFTSHPLVALSSNALRRIHHPITSFFHHE